ncbi:MAG: hypothetical protein U9P42_07555 [Candidatus Fermentibacteria bacterium]|nr:hypothetical protein [Candidatus Fermentibacteria bacterium]
MKKTKTLLVLLILVLACKEKPATELTPIQMSTITTGAGMLARNLAYLPADSSWSEAPDEAFIQELELMSVNHTEVWPTFFRAAADTAMKLDQLEIQEQQEAIQAEML